ncbi:MAG: response regulator transcription factor [Chloroflexi bacterium]|nr:response regulator transcription factor [Chloroflexota bacterium]
MPAIRIVLAEDHALVREGTRRILEQHPDLEVVGEAGDGEQALELVGRLQPDVAILDIRLPKLSGIEVVRRMGEQSPKTKALMLTAYDDDDYILALMEAGATGYLLKTARANELVEAVRSVHRGEPVLHPAIAVKVARLWGHRRVAVEQGPAEELTSREREVVVLAAKGLRNKAIAETLGISVRTVEGHFNNILAKLGVSSRTEAVLYALSRRWVSLEEERI